jgi:hypothetical protein
MKQFVCIVDRTFFNKKIWYEGEVLNADDELAKTVKKAWFMPKDDFDKKNEVVVKKVKAAENNGKTIKEVIKEAEEEKAKMKKEYEEKIEKLEKAK